LEEAVEYCHQKGIEFYAVNKNYPEEVFDNSISRKIHADVYIDDKNVGGFPGWSEIWQMLNPSEEDIKKQLKKIKKMNKKPFIKRIFNMKKK